MANDYKHPEPIAKEFEGISKKMKTMQNSIAKKSVRRDDNIDTSKMEDSVMYLKKIDGKLTLRVKIDGVETVLFKE